MDNLYPLDSNIVFSTFHANFYGLETEENHEDMSPGEDDPAPIKGQRPEARFGALGVTNWYGSCGQLSGGEGYIEKYIFQVRRRFHHYRSRLQL
jgi:hypothetical protein